MKRLRRALLAALLLSGCVGQSGPAINAPEPSPAPVPEASAKTPADAPSVLTAAIQCAGDQDVRVENKTIEVAGDAVIASAACDIWIVNSVIRAGGWGIIISGAGDVYIEGSTVEGKLGAVNISNAGDLHAKDTKFHGARTITGAGEYKDLGGNSWPK